MFLPLPEPPPQPAGHHWQNAGNWFKGIYYKLNRWPNPLTGKQRVNSQLSPEIVSFVNYPLKLTKL